MPVSVISVKRSLSFSLSFYSLIPVSLIKGQLAQLRNTSDLSLQGLGKAIVITPVYLG